MSTAPSGWQNPKMNWGSPDVPLPPDFNRIESNINAIEQGARTLDPSQAPTGNQGTLRQILSWFANRIRAITGTTNWYDSPPTTLTAAKSHIDAAAPHSGHATKDAVDAKFHPTTGHKHTGAAGDGPKLDPTEVLTWVPVRIETGSYIGDATESRFISVPFAPKLVVINSSPASGYSGAQGILNSSCGIVHGGNWTSIRATMKCSGNGFIVGFYDSQNHFYELNGSGITYTWVAIG